MSDDQRETFGKFLSTAMTWIVRVAFGFAVWLLLEIYSDFNEIKRSVQSLQGDVQVLKSEFQIMRDYDLKPKK